MLYTIYEYCYRYHVVQSMINRCRVMKTAKHDMIIIYNLLKIQIDIIIRYLMIRIYDNRSILLNVVL